MGLFGDILGGILAPVTGGASVVASRAASGGGSSGGGRLTGQAKEVVQGGRTLEGALPNVTGNKTASNVAGNLATGMPMFKSMADEVAWLRSKGYTIRPGLGGVNDIQRAREAAAQQQAVSNGYLRPNVSTKTGQAYMDRSAQYGRDAVAASQRQDPMVDYLQSVASGTAPTAADLSSQYQQQQAMHNIAANAAAMGALRNPALARQAMMQQSAFGQDIAGQTAAAAAKERQAAAGLAGQLNSVQRGQEIGANQAMSDIENRNFGNLLGRGNMALQQRAGFLDSLQSTDQNALQREALIRSQEMAPYQTIAGISPAALGASASRYGTNMGMFSNLLQGGLGALGGLFMSDRTKKKKIKAGDTSIKEFLGSLKAHEYEYKNPDLPVTGPGKHVSVMAQDLEKSAIGKRMIVDTPAGKMVDYSKGVPAYLAALANLNERVNRVERKK